MPPDQFTREKITAAVHELSRIVGRLDQLIGIISRPRENGEQAKSKQSAATQEEYAAIGKAFLSSHEPTPAKYPEKPKKRFYKTFDWWKKVVEIIAIPFAIGYAIITYFQWRDLRHNFEADERAWIKAEVNLPLTLDPNAPVVITARNVGKSPALEMYGGVVVEVVDADKTPSYPSGQDIRQFVARMIFPSDATSIQSGRTPNKPDGTVLPLTGDEVRRLASGQAYLAAFGILTYKDQFGGHWTRFCSSKGYQIGPKDYRTLSCANFNTAGDGTATWKAPD